MLLLILIILIGGVIFLTLQTKPENQNSEDQDQVEEENIPQISGNKDDLVSFSILPGAKLKGVVSYEGSVKGAYFFEANILVNILDGNKNILKNSNAMATTDWMTVDPVSFEGTLDFTGLPKGPAYIQIQNDNPSDLRENDKFIYIPIIIE